MGLELHIRQEGGASVIVLNGRLDGNTSRQFAEFWGQNLAETDAQVVLDATGLEFVSSAGLRELLQLAKRQAKLKTKPVICGAQENVAQALEIAGFDMLFDRAADVAAACKPASAKTGFFGGLFGGDS